VTAAGGTGPYTYSIVPGSLPPGLTLNPNTGLISGTPTSGGQTLFTVHAVDANGNTGDQPYAFNVGTVALTITPPTLPSGSQGVPYSQNLTASGGTAPYAFALTAGALPAGLVLGGSGAITGTPTGTGLSTFTVTATDNVGNTGTASYTINIGGNNLTVAPATLPNGTLAVPYSQTVTASGGTGGPYTFALASGTLPPGLTMNAGGLISGTPTAGGPATFTVRAQDGLGNFGTRLYSVTIGTPSLSIDPATLPAAVTGRPYSKNVIATGGTAPYLYSISAGALPPGVTLNPNTGLISGTPTGIGPVTFTVQAIDANGNIGSRTYTLTSRGDPASDPEVQGLVTAQVASAQRFASAQLNNINGHLAGLHDHFDPCSFNFGLQPRNLAAPPPYGAPLPPQYGAPLPQYAPPQTQFYGAPPPQYRAPAQPQYAAPPQYGPLYYDNPNAVYAPYARSGVPAAVAPEAYRPRGDVTGQLGQQRPVKPPECASDWASEVAVWTAGSFQFGSQTPNGATAANKFNTAGLTLGVDLRASDSLIVGISFGYGGDRTDIGTSGSRSEATSLSAMLYACLRAFDNLFIDGAIGYGGLNYDNRRWVTGDSALVSGKRNGDYWFGVVTLSYEIKQDGAKLAPYIGTDFLSATFDGYGEQGLSSQLLSYAAMKNNAVSVTAGLRGSIDIPVLFGTLTPNARIEYRATSQSDINQAMFYSDLGGGLGSTFSQAAAKQGVTTAAAGLRARSPGGLALELEYAYSTGNNGYSAQSLRGAVRLPF
jgi:uncharacterized protein YhjY with autotransporter beta-barrel domain